MRWLALPGPALPPTGAHTEAVPPHLVRAAAAAAAGASPGGSPGAAAGAAGSRRRLAAAPKRRAMAGGAPPAPERPVQVGTLMGAAWRDASG